MIDFRQIVSDIDIWQIGIIVVKLGFESVIPEHDTSRLSIHEPLVVAGKQNGNTIEAEKNKN